MLGVLGENLITLLAFDATHAPIIRGAVDIKLFSGPQGVIAAAIYDYLDKYKKPPDEHLPDLLVDYLSHENKSTARLYADILSSMKELYSKINTEYVMTQLEQFISRQSLRALTGRVGTLVLRDTPEALEEAQSLILSARAQQLRLFDPGLRLSQPKQALQFLDIQTQAFPTGIRELDKRGFGPTRKEMWLFIATAKKGKSWACIHLAKMAMMQRLRVVHISLEMSRHRCAQRYLQACFGLAKRREQLRVTHMERDDRGRFTDYITKAIMPRLSMDDPEVKSKLERLITDNHRILNNVYIKDFPTGQLTVPQLCAYLDNLHQQENFTPDLLIVDYPDLMKVPNGEYRLELDRIYKDLRGIAVERNLALVVVSQAHRTAAKAKFVGGHNVAEAYSKIAHADIAITYSQNEETEEPLGLARLKVTAGRNDEAISVLVSQQYAIGGFALESYLMHKSYWKVLPEAIDVEAEKGTQ